MHFPLPRLLALALAASLGLAAAGLSWEAVSFGLSEEATAARLERDVRARVADRERQVVALARRVSGLGPLVTAAEHSPDQAPALFARLADLTTEAVERGASVTLYAPSGPPVGYRVIAWSAGPSDQIPSERLSGPSRLFVAQGTAGPRLVYVLPLEDGDRRVGVAVAETLLAPAAQTAAAADSFRLASRFGPVAAVPAYAGAGAAAGAPREDTFVIVGEDDSTLLEIGFSSDVIAAQREDLRRRTFGVALMPWVLVLFVAGLRFRPTAAASRTRVQWPFAAGAAVTVAGGLAVGLAKLVGAQAAWDHVVLGVTLIALVVLFAGPGWWQPGRRLKASERRGRFVAEHLAAGVLIAGGLVLLSSFVADKVDRESLDPWQSPLFPVTWHRLIDFAGLLLVEIAAAWAAAALLSGLARRWRLTWQHPSRGLPAAALWVMPTLALVVVFMPFFQPAAELVWVALAASLFALWSADLRHAYRRTSQAARLMLLFGAMALPTVLLSQVPTFHAERHVRQLIERDFMPAVAEHPVDLKLRLTLARAEVDSLPGLTAFVTPTGSETGTVTSKSAFAVWSHTNLSAGRLTSEVELFGPDLVLMSRFGLNVPEFEYVEGSERWGGEGCDWRVFDELRRFGADDRRMSHAERGICDGQGRLLGAVVVHVLPDYHSLPFVASANTYYDLLSAPEGSATLQPRDLAVTVYGWGLNPLFTSGGAAWALSGDLFARLRASRDAFWARVDAEGLTYQAFVSSDRAGIYSIGYPVQTWFDVVTRFADTTAVIGGLFVAYLLAAALYAPFARRRHAPLRAVFHEVRTSFYRKLFLFFVLAAVGPVLLLTLAVGAYMSAKFNADVVSEASDVARVARRVFEQLSAAVQHPDEPQRVPTDDEMVLIRQMIDQDVNLYRGPDLIATSQRDLFEAGLLPTRTPAAAYRAIALDRLPSFVAQDRLGASEYLMAAAPLPSLRQAEGALLTVPLALRQREISRDLQSLNRGVMVGAMLTVLFAAGLGASVAGRVSDPVARLSRATRQIAAGRLDVRIAADTADELRRLVDDFNSMTARLVAQRAELARSQQLKAWAEMAHQVAHEIKNPLTPIQLAAEHLGRVHQDQGRPLGSTFDQCISTIIRQVHNLRQIASEFSNFAGTPTPRPAATDLPELIGEVVDAYQLAPNIEIRLDIPPTVPAVWADRTLVARALTNLVENAVQAMPGGGRLAIGVRADRAFVVLTLTDSGVGMPPEAVARAFEPYFSTKTRGSGLGLANARRNVELCGGDVNLASTVGRGTVVTVRLPVAPPSADFESG